MKRTFKVRFYCRNSRIRKDGTAPVEISIIVCGEREFFSLPRSCNPKQFPTEDLKVYCTGVENKINTIYTALTVADETVSAYILKDAFLNGYAKNSYPLKRMFEDGFALKLKEDPNPSTYRKYEIVRDYFYEHTGFPPSKEASSVTYADIMLVKASLERKLKPATVQKMLMRLKYFFHLAFNSGKIRSNPFAAVRIRRIEGESVYLTEEELNRLINVDIPDDKCDRARDTFCFLAGTGLEYADLKALKPEDLKFNGSIHYIAKKRVKTGIEYIAVVQDFAMEIWNFYDGKIPLISNQKLNKYLKTCQKIAKIDKNLTTLCARHTYATMALNRGLSIDVVSKMLGHSNVEQTKTYARLLDKTVLAANEALKKSPYKPLKISGGTSAHIGRESSPETKTAGTGDDWEEELRKLSEALGI